MHQMRIMRSEETYVNVYKVTGVAMQQRRRKLK